MNTIPIPPVTDDGLLRMIQDLTGLKPDPAAGGGIVLIGCGGVKVVVRPHEGPSKRTKEEIRMRAFGYDIVIPKGTRVTSHTAMGYDPSYNFVDEFEWAPRMPDGTLCGMFLHDAKYHGINIAHDLVETY